MAGGGFHGGSSHSGGHHGGGGGFSGGGGGFSGGGFGGFGGGSHYSGGGFYGRSGNDDDEDMGRHLVAYLIFCGVVVAGTVFSALFTLVGEGEVPGFNYGNLTIFFASGFFYFFSLKDSKRTSVIKEFKKGYLPTVYGCVWKGENPFKRIGDGNTWYAPVDKRYRIAFYDREYGVDNAEKVMETINRTPKIIWVLPGKWLVFGIISFISSFFFYELVIPVFENAIMTDQAFAFFDELVFYFPSLICLLCSIASFVLVRVRDNLLYQVAERAVNDNKAAEVRKQTESMIASRLSEKWYYNNCPNCGAPASHALRSCSCCGTSLEVRSFDKGMNMPVHRISANAGAKSKKDEG